MSWWTDFRDTIESVAGLVANYFYPGTIALGHWVNSKGSQEQLFGTTWGQAAGALTSLGGMYANAAGAGASGASGTMNGLGAEGTASGVGSGVSGTATLNADPDALRVASEMIQNGASPSEAIQTAGITPAQAEAAGLTPGAGQTWGDVAQQSGIGYVGETGVNAINPVGTGGGGGSGMGGGTTAAQQAAKGAAAMPWGTSGNLYTMGTSALGMLGAGALNNAAIQAGSRADPFGPQRKLYADRMARLMENPDAIVNEPGFQAGQRAIERSMASQGYTGSGNMAAAMQKYGGDFFDKAMSMYGGLAGAQFNPANAAQLRLQGQMGALSLAGQSLNRMGYGVGMAQFSPQDAERYGITRRNQNGGYYF